jgi:hypothetical protein
MEDCLMSREWRGCLTIRKTPFDDEVGIKEDDLCAEIDRVGCVIDCNRFLS